MSNLRNLIQPDAIRLLVRASNWRAAVTAAGTALVDVGACGPSYTQAMLEALEKHGPYIVIAPGFALPHARPDASVTRTALSFVRLADPVAFGNEENDPVRLVMGLVASDDDAHRAALAELAELLVDPERCQRLMAADTPDAVLAALGPVASADPAPRRAKDVVPIAASATTTEADAIPSKGLGTSLFLKNTLEKVLGRWGWSPYLNVEATDTISARGRAKEADVVMTSGAIAQALGDLGVPVEVITDFTSTAELDAALRRIYVV